MDCEASLDGGGEVCIQLLQSLGAASTPPSGGLLVTLLIRKRVTQGDPLLMVLYGVILVHLAEYLWAADLGLLSPFYTDGAVFVVSARRSSRLLKLLMEMGPGRGYFSETSKFLFVADTPG